MATIWTDRGGWMRLRSRHLLVAKMAEHHYSLQNVADLAHCSKATVAHLARGARTTCSPAMAVRLEKALRCAPGELFEARAQAS